MVNPRTPSQVAQLLGVSADTVRRYADQFSAHLSPSASPGKGNPRTFDEDDLAVLAYALELRRESLSLEEVAARLRTGVIAGPPAAIAEGSQASQAGAMGPALPEEATRALVRLADSLEAVVVQGKERERELQAQLLEAQHRIGELEGELRAVKDRARPWWKRWFGGD
jgi:DNA-binding transcriptional MerR regulator